MTAEPRSYVSPRRRQQADETRRRIVDAARKLLADQGYAVTTIAGIAAAAGVAAPTIYAAFGSKHGILKALIDRAIFSLEYETLVIRAFEQEHPADRLRVAARIACEIYQAERAELDFLSAAGVVAPELAVIDDERESQRFATQAAVIESIADALRPGVTLAAAQDIFWTLTSRDLFRMLVVARQWSAERYQDWLAALLAGELLGQPA